MGEVINTPQPFDFDAPITLEKVELPIKSSVKFYHDPTDAREFKALLEIMDKGGMLTAEAAKIIRDVGEFSQDDDDPFAALDPASDTDKFIAEMENAGKRVRAAVVDVDVYDSILAVFNKLFYTDKEGKTPADVSGFLTQGVLNSATQDRIDAFLDVAIEQYAKARGETLEKYKVKKGNRQQRRAKK